MELADIPIDKLGIEHYMRNYDEFLGPLRDKDLRLLELGIAKGDSLRHWAEWLPQARIVGLDINPVPEGLASSRIAVYQGEQQDPEVLDRIAHEQAPDGFDVIVDDASHVGQFTRLSFWHLFTRHLKPGGLYFIEDWGTGYWSKYVDGRHYHPAPPAYSHHERLLNRLSRLPFVSHSHWLRKAVGWSRWHLVQRSFPSHQRGMVGFVKELVDECGMPDITHKHFGTGEDRPSRIEWMRISLGHVIVKKPIDRASPD